VVCVPAKTRARARSLGGGRCSGGGGANSKVSLSLFGLPSFFAPESRFSQSFGSRPARKSLGRVGGEEKVGSRGRKAGDGVVFVAGFVFCLCVWKPRGAGVEAKSKREARRGVVASASPSTATRAWGCQSLTQRGPARRPAPPPRPRRGRTHTPALRALQEGVARARAREVSTALLGGARVVSHGRVALLGGAACPGGGGCHGPQRPPSKLPERPQKTRTTGQ
jgi:hypothetical protein